MLFNAGETKTNIRKEMADAIGVIECDKCAQIAVNQQFFDRNADRIYTRCHNRSCDAQPFICSRVAIFTSRLSFIFSGMAAEELEALMGRL